MGSISHADYGIRTDERDAELLRQREQAWAQREGPRVGDFLRFADGSLHRLAHDWGDSFQTSRDGTFYLLPNGLASMSGSLSQPVPNDRIRETPGKAIGRFWFFHHDAARAHAAVYVDMECRVFATDLPQPKP